MTEYEVADLALSTQSIFWQQFQVGQGHMERIFDFFQQFGTVLFGYLIVSYFIGAQLTRVQAAILTTLYLFWLFRLVTVFNFIWIAAQNTLGEMRKISPDYSPAVPSVWGVYALLLCLVLGSLYFMWSVRHPKTE
jgi:hypothetical protein